MFPLAIKTDDIFDTTIALYDQKRLSVRTKWKTEVRKWFLIASSLPLLHTACWLQNL